MIDPMLDTRSWSLMSIAPNGRVVTTHDHNRQAIKLEIGDRRQAGHKHFVARLEMEPIPDELLVPCSQPAKVEA